MISRLALPAVYLSLFGICVSVSPSSALAANAAKGAEFAEKWCNACHSIGNDEVRQEDAGPPFEELSDKDVGYLQAAINRPHDFMPEFPKLSSADKSDIIAYIQSLP